MGIFQTTVNLSSDLTTVKVVGQMTADDFWLWVKDFYAGAVTSLVLWDLVKADLSEVASAITTDEIRAHVRHVNAAATEVRKGGRTAYVVGNNLPAMRLAGMLQSFAETEHSPFERKTFSDLKDAMQWLGVGRVGQTLPTGKIDAR